MSAWVLSAPQPHGELHVRDSEGIVRRHVLSPPGRAVQHVPHHGGEALQDPGGGH